jgi:hypothetical protein
MRLTILDSPYSFAMWFFSTVFTRVVDPHYFLLIRIQVKISMRIQIRVRIWIHELGNSNGKQKEYQYCAQQKDWGPAGLFI